MSLLTELPEVIRASEKEYEKLRGASYRKIITAASSEKGVADFLTENGDEEDGNSRNLSNTLFYGDNLALLSDGINGGWLKGKVDLIYCDPPFFTRAVQNTRREISSKIVPDIKCIKQNAYDDKWNHDMREYLEMLTVRLMFMRDALSETGSIFLHLDWHAVHAVKLIMDEIFGPENFVNEIIWTYKSGGAAKRHFSRKHDNILFYSKSGRYKFHVQKEKSYNRGYKPYRFKGVEEFEDEIGWYTLVNQKDVWHIDMVGRSSGERVNYATQKPEALIANIIEAATDEGDICADFFCGSGTLGVAAAACGRRFMCADSGELAVASTVKRLLKADAGFQCIGCSFGDAPELSDNFDIDAEFSADRIVLSGYSAIVEDMPVKSGQSEMLEKLLREDSLAFIDYWCAGWTDGSGCFHCDRLFHRDRRGFMENEYIKEDVQLELGSSYADDNQRTPAVMAVDIFGRILLKCERKDI